MADFELSHDVMARGELRLGREGGLRGTFAGVHLPPAVADWRPEKDDGESRVFNTSGPCDPAKHYMLPAEERLSEARELIDLERYFVLHAPRQTGKITTVVALVASLNAADSIRQRNNPGKEVPTGTELRGPLHGAARRD